MLKVKNSAIQICSETIHPGESLSLALPLPELFSCSPLYMPVKVVHGKQAGPCFLITAGMYGNQLNGTEIINRLLNLTRLKKIRGTLILIPVLNVYGLMNRTKYLPGGVNLNTCFPGSESGTHASRMANIFTQEIFSKADVCLDLQTGSANYTNLPQVYASPDNAESQLLAEAFNAPVVSAIDCQEGMLSSMAADSAKPFLLYEAGEAMRFDEQAIKTGVRGIVNVMQKLSMLPEKPAKKPAKFKSFKAEKNIWIRASTSGISYTKYKLGQHIKRGEIICIIKDPFGSSDDIAIVCPEEGVVVGKNNLPLVHEGEALFQIAIFPKIQHVASHLEGWSDQSTARHKESDAE